MKLKFYLEQQIHGLIVRDAAGNLYVAEADLNRVIKISGSTVAIIAGTDTAGYNGDGGPAIAAVLRNPTDVEFDAADNIYISDANNYRIRRVDAATG